ncbi:MAG: phospholipase A [Flavobacteriales bacterium]|nr:phospholipase A [Flavobacteriales bacterium]
MKKLLFVLLSFWISNIYAQIDFDFTQRQLRASQDTSKVVRDSLNKALKDQISSAMETIPPFCIFKDNYFISGTNFNGGINSNNSDVKYQISVMDRLIKGALPYDTYLFITYTQKSFWDIYKESAPFEDTNFNPSLGIGNNIVVNDRLAGIVLLQIEHESNGRDSIWNRSWNMVSTTGIYEINRNFNVQMKIWIPFWLAKENKDIAQYKGYWHIGGMYNSTNKRWYFSAVVTKRGGWNFGANVALEAAFRLTKRSNQYICFQYYNGYGESLLDYKQYSNYLRFGLVIKPTFWHSIL